jgi:Tfp pilus assembly protein PilX
VFMANVDVILNLVIALLLVITIVFCLVLSRRISAFNSNKNDLKKFLVDFNSSIQKAEKNINQLKELGSNVDENLKAQIKRARFLANDLSFLSEKGENVAQNLEGKINISRDVHRRASTDNLINTQTLNRQARDILSGEEPFRPKQPTAPQTQNPNLMSPTKRQALDALLQEIARKKSES